MKRIAAGALLGLALSGAACPKEDPVARPDTNATQVPRARDGDVAIRQELEAARRAGTLAAYDLFIARHPDHPLAEVAREERARHAQNPPK